MSPLMLRYLASALGGENGGGLNGGGLNGGGGKPFPPWRSDEDDHKGERKGERGRRRSTTVGCDAQMEVHSLN